MKNVVWSLLCHYTTKAHEWEESNRCKCHTLFDRCKLYEYDITKDNLLIGDLDSLTYCRCPQKGKITNILRLFPHVKGNCICDEMMGCMFVGKFLGRKMRKYLLYFSIFKHWFNLISVSVCFPRSQNRFSFNYFSKVYFFIFILVNNIIFHN